VKITEKIKEWQLVYVKSECKTEADKVKADGELELVLHAFDTLINSSLGLNKE